MNVPKVTLRQLKGSKVADLGRFATQALLSKAFPFQTRFQLKSSVQAMVYSDCFHVSNSLSKVGKVDTLEALTDRIAEILPGEREYTINILGSRKEPLVVIVSDLAERPMALKGVEDLSPVHTVEGNNQKPKSSALDRTHPDALLDLTIKFRSILKHGK